MRKNFERIFVVLISFCLAFSGCTPSHTTAPASPLPATVAPTQVKPPTATSISTIIPTLIPTPVITLNKGDFYFSIDGQQSFMFSRNMAGYETSQYYQLLDLTSTGGSKFVRIQLDSFGMGHSNTGEVDEAWAKKWEDVFEKAAFNGIYVMPTFSAWYDWNNGNGYSTWKSNPLNAVNGGPVASPAELFQKDSATQILWLQWMQTLVERWQGRGNILAWEVFSEVNLASGSTETTGIDFVNTAVALIQSTDPERPVTASIADCPPGSGACYWPDFYKQAKIDFVEMHPYPPSAQLDRTIISEARQSLARYGRPVLIGESGLSAATPDSSDGKATVAENARRGIRHAIWAAVVSGAMNGRALWWEDGVAIYFPALNLPFIQTYANADLPASNFVRGVEFSGFKPLTSTSSSGVWGAAIGNEKMALGWYRDAGSEPPDWNLRQVISRQTVTITIPGSATNLKIDFYDTRTGTDILSSTMVTRNGDKVTVTLPDFTDDIAFKMYAQK